MVPAGLRPLILAATLAASAAAAQAQPAWRTGEEAMADRAAGVTRFKCSDGGDITAQFATENARLVAIVDAGFGPHALPLEPWNGGPAKIIWTDGMRRLVWNPGVQITFDEGPTHRMCGRDGGHRH
jgi:hypothetical protein